MMRRFSFLVSALALMSFAAVPSSLFAGEPRTHDGFLLRLSAGVGAAGTKLEDATGSIDISGVPSDLNIAIGAMVAPNFAIHGTLWGWSMSDPDADITIAGVGTGSGSISGDVTMAAVGGGVTYYVMPVNLYLSGSVGFGSLELDADSVSGETDNGVVIDLTAGKEWWVGNSWGLGVAGGFSYHSLPDGGVDENWTGTSFTVRFSATMN